MATRTSINLSLATARAALTEADYLSRDTGPARDASQRRAKQNIARAQDIAASVKATDVASASQKAEAGRIAAEARGLGRAA